MKAVDSNTLSMRFLDTKTCQFVEVIDAKVVCYSILSHTWDRCGEQTFQDLKIIQDRYTPKASRLFVAEPKEGSLMLRSILIEGC